MTFLNPAILLGLLAASIPVVLHFLNLRKLKKIEFSTLTFLKELQKTKIRRIKLKQLLLLLLRVLIIIFLVFAFARPAFKGITVGSSTAKTTAVFINDNTFSMSVIGSGGSNFNRVKQSAEELLNNFQQGDEIMILPLAFKTRDEYKPKSDFNFVKREIDDMKISGVTNTIHNAIVKAGQILYESKNINKEIYLFSDLQQGMIYNNTQELEDLSRIFNNVQTFIIGTTESKPINLGVDDFKINNQIFEPNMKIGFTANIKNYSSSAVSNSVASLFINGRRSAQQSISLLPTETATINFETILTDTGFVEAYVELEDDDIIYDNKRFVSFYVPAKINLLILTDITDDALFTKLALSTTTNRFNINEINLTRLPTVNLNKYDVVIVIGSEGNNNWDKLRSYVEFGGGLIVMPGSKSTIESFQKLCESFGFSITSSFVGNINSEQSIFKFDKIDLMHPIFSELFDDKSKTKIESPDIYYYLRTIAGTVGRTIISMEDNSSFLSEYRYGTGNILVFNSAPLISWTNLPLKSLFAPLIHKSVLYISSNINEQNNYTAGEDISAKLNSSLSKQIRVVRPDNTSDYFNTDSLTNRNYITYSNSDLFGVYKFYSSDRMFYHAAVNHNSLESVTNYYDKSSLQDYFNKINPYGSTVFLENETDISRVVYETRFGSEIWKYLLITALLLALIEMYVAKSSRKDLNEIKA